MTVKDNLSEHLKNLRETKQISQEKLAAKADISPRYYQSVEAGKSIPSVFIVMKIAIALNIEYTEILDPVWDNMNNQSNSEAL